jgi:hypothetical protein
VSTANLPEWALALPGFDPSRRHWDIVCTGNDNGNDSHVRTLLGIAYQRDEWPTWHVAGPHIGTSQRVDRDGTPNGEIHPELGVREAGSVPITCPECGRTQRYPLVEWATWIAKLADVDPGANGQPTYIDLSKTSGRRGLVWAGVSQ